MSLFSAGLRRNCIAAVHDAVMAGLSFLLAVYLRLGDEQLHIASDYLKSGTLIFVLVCVSVFISMRLYQGLWRYASMRDMITIVKAVTLSILIFALIMFVFNRLQGVPRSVFFINWLLLIWMLGGPRFAYRAIKDRTLTWKMTLDEAPKIPVLLIGAGDQAEQFIRDANRDQNAPYEIVAIMDDDIRQKGRAIHGVPIYSSDGGLSTVVQALDRKVKKPQRIIVSGDHTGGQEIRYLLEAADTLGIPLARLPRLSELKHGAGDGLEVRPIAVEDLLGRPQNVLDRDSMQRLVRGKAVLVTGAGGTIGGELTRQLAAFAPAKLILAELSEFNLYQIEREIRGSFPDVPLAAVLSDVRDGRHVDVIFRHYKPALVFHAAAIKHVPLAEANIEETILTNVFGTRHVAEACQKHGVEVMLMISTDKAVNPLSVMGATKRLAENFCQALGENARSAGKTKFITVRFGNVLGSTGSVVPLFEEQLRKGGPITVTHRDMTRYFMTTREAVELVLQAAALGAEQERQECIFVLDMGQPVRIYDLAEQMIRLAGLIPHSDIKIAITGLRPGEKLYEELFHFAENAAKTRHESIYLASPRFTDLGLLRKAFDSLFIACAERRTGEALEGLKRLVPEFKSEA